MSDSVIKFIKVDSEPLTYFSYGLDKPVVNVEYQTSIFEVVEVAAHHNPVKLTQTIWLTYKIDGQLDTVSIDLKDEWLGTTQDYENSIAYFLTQALNEKISIPNHHVFQNLITKFVANSNSNQINIAPSSNQTIARLSRELPGIYTKVEYPCKCVREGYTWTAGYDADGKPILETIVPNSASLYDVIIHLNDICKWSREKIADWIDELHDAGKINAEFQPWNEAPEKPVEKNPCVEITIHDNPNNPLPVSWEITKNKLSDEEKQKKIAQINSAPSPIIGIGESKVYIAPQGVPDSWQEVGYTSEPIKIEFESDSDKIKYNATQHFSLGPFSIDPSNVIKGDVS